MPTKTPAAFVPNTRKTSERSPWICLLFQRSQFVDTERKNSASFGLQRSATRRLLFSSYLSSAHFQNCFLHCLLRLTNRLGAFSRIAAVLVRRGSSRIMRLIGLRGAALVKLVHRSIEKARPACSSWPLLPAASIRIEHEPVGAKERPSTQLALPGACSTKRWFTSAIKNKEIYLIRRLETALRPSA
jgi:hypothetical protein